MRLRYAFDTEDKTGTIEVEGNGKTGDAFVRVSADGDSSTSCTDAAHLRKLADGMNRIADMMDPPKLLEYKPGGIHWINPPNQGGYRIWNGTNP